MGSTRAFLNDGVLFYKKKWGYQIERESRAGFFLKVMRISHGISSFLGHNPYITTGKEGNNVMFFDKSESAARQTLKNVNVNLELKGLNGIVIHSLADDTAIKQITRIPIGITENERL
jgi:hypothetical protein